MRTRAQRRRQQEQGAGSTSVPCSTQQATANSGEVPAGACMQPARGGKGRQQAATAAVVAATAPAADGHGRHSTAKREPVHPAPVGAGLNHALSDQVLCDQQQASRNHCARGVQPSSNGCGGGDGPVPRRSKRRTTGLAGEAPDGGLGLGQDPGCRGFARPEMEPVSGPGPGSGSDGDPGWQKALWKQQARPDNYTDASFLEALVVNAGVERQRRYWPIVLGACAVSQQISTVAAASLAVPAHLRRGSLTVGALLAADAALLASGYLLCALLGGHLLGGSIRRGLRQCALLVGGVLFLSPLLRSLTRTVSEDSVIALTVTLLLVHLFLHDYSFVNSVTDRLTGAVSLCSAVLAAVLVASLMPSDLAVFAQVLFSLEAYLLWPYARRYIHAASVAAHVAFTLLLAAAASALLWPLSHALTAVFGACLVLVSFVCPYWLVSIHKFKAKINGPWDEAVPHIPRVLLGAAAVTPGSQA